MNNNKAQSIVEYGLILALVAIVAVAAVQIWSNKISTTSKNAGQAVENAGSKKTYEQMCESADGEWDEDTGICNPKQDNKE